MINDNFLNRTQVKEELKNGELTTETMLALMAAVDRLDLALSDYGRHLSGCPMSRLTGDPCTCGLTRVKESIQ